MFINYITLMLINMVAGLFLLKHYGIKGLDGTDPETMDSQPGMTGGIALTIVCT